MNFRNLLIKIFEFLFFLALVGIIVNIIQNIIFLKGYYGLGDYWIYHNAIIRYLSNENPYQNGFGYFPSFFLMIYLIYNPLIYIIFLVISALIMYIFLFDQLENKVAIAFIICTHNLAIIFGGNIDVFIYLIIVICIKYRKHFWIAILLGFVSFKPSLILVIPFFLYHVKEKFLFLCIYISTFVLTNIYFLLIDISIIFLFWNYSWGSFSCSFAWLRPQWIIYTYYYWILNFNRT